LVYDDDSLTVSTHTLFIEGARLYLVSNKRFWSTSPYADVDIFSLANPTRPRYLSTINLPQNIPGTGAHALFSRRDTLFVSGGYGGMFIYDLRNPTQPRLLKRFGDHSGDVYNHTSWTTTDNNLMVMEEEVPHGRPLQLFDVSNIQNPRPISAFNSYVAATPHNPFIVQDRYVVSSWYQDGLQVWDISNPTTPTRIAYYDTYPDNDSSTVPMSGLGYDGYKGCWGAYPFLPSGNILASDIKYGLFVFSPPYPVTGLPAAPAKSTLRLWPNPTTDQLRLSLGHPASRLTVDVLNAIGQRARPTLALSAPYGEATLSLADLPAGIYFLRISADGQPATVRRVVRQ
ncbi:MAG TPA: choice-of-anchor B family protein, partial [bacterium]|nr:choice-of-anchor B family protein [bacterium]